jgi:hypothetical protein
VTCAGDTTDLRRLTALLGEAVETKDDPPRLTSGERARLENLRRETRAGVALTEDERREVWAAFQRKLPWLCTAASGYVPRGAEVELAPVLRELPKKPPTSRRPSP